VTSGLLIADDPMMREILRALLEAAGYQVVTAEDGVEGLTRISEDRPDAVMVDSQMPGLGGGGVIREIRAGTASGMAVVLMSGRSSEAEVDAGLEAGADLYLVKPFAPSDVFAILSEALRVRPPEERSG